MTPGNELIVCGWDEVFILDMNNREQGRPRKVWSWRAADQRDLPDELKPAFGTTDECKPFDSGTKILITSSRSGVAYVDRLNNRTLFHGQAFNAHSADLLPGNRVAVAASDDPEGRGDRLIIFDMKQPNHLLLTEELSHGHGVVWDEQRNVLWALSDTEIRAYALEDWKTASPKLDRVFTFALPESGGHDFYPVPGTPCLGVTTRQHCWLFDRDKKALSPHPRLAGHAGVKCISQHPVTRRTVYVQAEAPNWWAERLHFLGPEGTFHVPGEHFYKARWSV
mgnify:CR=1 FL=1